jgi:hypothetical protein
MTQLPQPLNSAYADTQQRNGDDTTLHSSVAPSSPLLWELLRPPVTFLFPDVPRKCAVYHRSSTFSAAAARVLQVRGVEFRPP